MSEQGTCNRDPSLCLECMRQPVEYKQLGAYVVPVCMKNVYAQLEDEFAAASAEAIRKRAEVLAERARETPVTLRLVEEE